MEALTTRRAPHPLRVNTLLVAMALSRHHQGPISTPTHQTFSHDRHLRRPPRGQQPFPCQKASRFKQQSRRHRTSDRTLQTAVRWWERTSCICGQRLVQPPPPGTWQSSQKVTCHSLRKTETDSLPLTSTFTTITSTVLHPWRTMSMSMGRILSPTSGSSCCQTRQLLCHILIHPPRIQWAAVGLGAQVAKRLLSPSSSSTTSGARMAVKLMINVWHGRAARGALRVAILSSRCAATSAKIPAQENIGAQRPLRSVSTSRIWTHQIQPSSVASATMMCTSSPRPALRTSHTRSQASGPPRSRPS